MLSSDLSLVGCCLGVGTFVQPLLLRSACASWIFLPTSLGTPDLPVDTDSVICWPAATAVYGFGFSSTTVPASASFWTSLRTGLSPLPEMMAAASVYCLLVTSGTSTVGFLYVVNVTVVSLVSFEPATGVWVQTFPSATTVWAPAPSVHGPALVPGALTGWNPAFTSAALADATVWLTSDGTATFFGLSDLPSSTIA